MQQKEVLEQLYRKLTDNDTDAKAEVPLALLMASGVREPDFIISCDSYFCREYNRDIMFAELREDAGKKEYLQLHLTRAGLYDQLPEGLFFQHSNSFHQSFLAKDMAAEFKVNKQKEQEVRRFFAPIENEYFLQRIQMEKEEMRLLDEFQPGRL